MTNVPGRFHATAIILAGGKSRRMGRDKALIDYRGVPLIQHVAEQLRPHFPEILISADEPTRLAFLGLPVVVDASPEQGPLGGIASAMAQARHDWCFVVATDLPEIPVGVLDTLFAHSGRNRCVVPVTGDGRRQPLFALYHRTLLPEINDRLSRKQYRVWALSEGKNACLLPIDLKTLPNLNTPADLGENLG